MPTNSTTFGSYLVLTGPALIASLVALVGSDEMGKTFLVYDIRLVPSASTCECIGTSSISENGWQFLIFKIENQFVIKMPSK